MVKKLAGDFEIADTTQNIPHPYEAGMAEEWISTQKGEFEAGEGVTFAITLRPSKALIGVIGLKVNKPFKRAELGYWIGKAYWNRGYCTEAGRMVLAYGFGEMGLNKISAHHFSRNPASGKVMRKLKMRKEGALREHIIKWDQFEDVEAYAILRREWEEGKGE